MTRNRPLTQRTRMAKDRVRRMRVETLERREMLAAEIASPLRWTPIDDGSSHVDPILAPDSDPDVIDRWTGLSNGLADPINLQGSRWSNPASGPSPNLGDGATVTWSIVPDGTPSAGTVAGATSNLIAFMDGIYGAGGTTVAQRPWFRFFQQIYDGWSTLTGLNFVYEANDDGAAQGGAAIGQLGVRGDVRIAGSLIDGNSNVLAFNYFPSGGGFAGLDGDMVIDTGDNFYVNNSNGPNGENRGLINVLQHEAGHGIGLGHTEPVNQTKLMEPFVNFAFLGAQHDDILAAQTLYGDRFDNNDIVANASPLGTLAAGSVTVDDVSIDQNNDVDWYAFDALGGTLLTVDLRPDGFQYLIGAQGGPAPIPFDSSRLSDLRFEVYDPTGRLVANESRTLLGETETLPDLLLTSTGTYTIGVFGTSVLGPAAGIRTPTQLYELSLSALAGTTRIEIPTATSSVVPLSPTLIGVGPHDRLLLETDRDDRPTLLRSTPSELKLSFDGRFVLDDASVQNAENVYLQFTETSRRNAFGFTVGNFPEPNFTNPASDPTLVPIGFRELDVDGNQLTLRFAETLRDGYYRLVITNAVTGDDTSTPLVESLAFNPGAGSGNRQIIDFEIEVGAQVVSVVPTPVDVVQDSAARTVNVTEHPNAIDVYFDSADIFAAGSSIASPAFYQLITTEGTVSTADDVLLGSPTSIITPAMRGITLPADQLPESERYVRLVFGSAINVLAGATTAETIRLRIGDAQNPTNQTFSAFTPNALGGGTFGSLGGRANFRVTGQSIAGAQRTVDYPGDNDQQGHRDISLENHLIAAADSKPGISTFYYSFSKGQKYGASFGSAVDNLDNLMSAEMESRFREVFGILGSTFGIDFIETPTSQLPTVDPNAILPSSLRIVLGDMFPVGGVNANGDGNLATYARFDRFLNPVNLLVFDANENWYEGFGDAPDNRPSIFESALTEIMRVLGLNDPSDLPQGSFLGYSPQIATSGRVEWVYPGNNDVVHGQHLYKPESLNVDHYRFQLTTAGMFNAEVIANRLANSSTLDARAVLLRDVTNGVGTLRRWEIVAINEDYFGADPFINLQLPVGHYSLAITSEGNQFDANSAAQGSGGTTEGGYELRVEFNPTQSVATLRDAAGTAFDGDRDGVDGGNYNFWFDVANTANTLYVHKNFGAAGNGGLTTPYSRLQTALATATPGQIVRILGDQGFDNDVTTQADNVPYLIGRSGTVLPDGDSLQVPAGVTVMVDAGALFKMLGSRVVVGSDTSANRLGGALQILGTPGNDVVFTSYNDRSVGTISNPINVPLRPGDWGGIEFRGDIDRQSGRTDDERKGIFVNYVNHASLSFGGGLVGGETVRPIDLSAQRPELSYNTIIDSASAAISADPESFEFTTFTENRYQDFGLFVPDYQRIGPEIIGNTLIGNSRNGLFIEIETLPGNRLEELTVPARFNDGDIVHILSENLLLAGSPGGPVVEHDPLGTSRGTRPDHTSLTVTNVAGGTLANVAHDYTYTFVDAFGNESLPSTPRTFTSSTGSLRISGLQFIDSTRPEQSLTADFVGRRIYRSDAPGTPFRLVGEIDRTATSFLDNGSIPAQTKTIARTDPRFNDGASFRRGGRDAGLVIDPGLIIKSGGARIELGIGTTLIAEGALGSEIVFTSISDDRFGAGGTFDTNDNVGTPGGDTDGERGDWGGLYAGRLSRLSLDSARIANAGGVTGLVGTTGAFNAVEIHQAEARIANTHFEKIANGLGGATTAVREGRGPNTAAIIYVVASQPIIVANTFDGRDDNDNVASNGDDSAMAAISINVDALNAQYVSDIGRQTGIIDVLPGTIGNQGPLVRGNRLQGVPLNAIVVREQTLTTESVWDDTDIVHVVLGAINIPNFHTVGGLRLESSNDESLVVKLFGTAAGFNANGSPLDITDRIGGRLHVVGTPGFPVILTSLSDSSVGAGFDLDGQPLNATNNVAFTSRFPTGPEVDRGTLIDNDVPDLIPGHFEFQPVAGGDKGASAGGGRDRVTTQGVNTFFPLQNSLFDYLNFIDVGADGGAVRLGSTTITLPPTLVAEDVVASEGSFAGANGLVNWRVEQSLDDGRPELVTKVSFSSAGPIGELRYINYYDPVIASDSGDILFTEGTPGTNNFRVTVLDGPERVGFRHYGTFENGTGLIGGRYEGWAADNWPQHAPGFPQPFTINGTIDTVDIPLINVPGLPQPNYGPAITTTAHSWRSDPLSNSVSFTAVLELLESPDSLVASGEWKGVVLDEYSHDRNVETVIELEGDISGFGDSNNLPRVSSQFLGLLASGEKASDENLRLGYTIQGAISVSRDVDVYEFLGTPGTQVWLDIDNTEFGLDSVIELIDIDGNILAISNNSLVEAGSPSTFATFMGAGRPMLFNPQASANADGTYRDDYSLNEGDAGMRVVLPGSGTALTSYFVRVRSANSVDLRNPALIATGETSGSYQLQIRLREQDEFAGSTVRYADIRYAATGIEIIGLPAHSPLAGTAVHTGASTFIGDVDASSRGVLSAAGALFNNQNEFTFDVNRRQVINNPSNLNPAVGIDEAPFATDPFDRTSVTIDIDYAEPNTTAYLFNGDRLIAIGTDSNVLDDRTIQVNPLNTTDLSRGSAGATDPFIGPIELSSAGDYRVVVSANNEISEALDQFTSATPTSTLVRLEPIDGQNRYADERFSILNDEVPQAFGGRGDQSPGQILQPLTFGTGDENVIAFDLGDIPLIALDNNQLKVFNAFTGRFDSTLNRSPNGAGTILDDATLLSNVGAFAGNSIGEMVGIDGRRADDGAVTFLGADGAILRSGTSGIATFDYQRTGTAPNFVHQSEPTTATSDVNANAEGLTFRATTYWSNNNGIVAEAFDRRIYAVADRNNFTGLDVVATDTTNPPDGTLDMTLGTGPAIVPIGQRTNMIFILSPNDGSVINRFNGVNRSPLPANLAAASPANYWAEDLAGANRNGNTSVPDYTPWSGTTNVGQVAVATTGSVTTIASDEDAVYAFTNNGEIFRYIVNRTIAANGPTIDNSALGDLDPDIANGDVNGLLPGTVLDSTGAILRFSNVTAGPLGFTLDGSDTVFFGQVAGSNNLFAFDIQDLVGGGDATAVRVFQNAAESSALSGASATTVQGLYFSPLTQNLWHLSNATDAVAGHGYGQLDDNRNVRDGGGSLYFGFEALDGDFNQRSATPLYQAGQVPASEPSGFDNGTAFPGGAYGTVESRDINLTGITAEDQPTLYFTYRLSTENAASSQTGTTIVDMRDSLRVFVAGDDNVWRLVATNNTGTLGVASPLTQEFSAGTSRFFNTVTQTYVQELFDDGANYRQARIDLGQFAGSERVRVRFEYTSNGEARPDQSEIRSLPGADIPDGHVVRIGATNFEFDHGLIIALPDADHLQDGNTFVVSQSGVPRTLTFRDVTTFAGVPGVDDVLFNPNETAASLAAKVAASLGNGSAVIANRPDQVHVPLGTGASAAGMTATGLIISSPGVAGTNTPIPISPALSEIQVRNVMRQVIADTVGDPNATAAERLSAFPLVGVNGIRLYTSVTQTTALLMSINGEQYSIANGGLPAHNFGLYRTGTTAFTGLGSRNNATSSVHLDDIVVGLAERGEAVSGGQNLNQFIPNPATNPAGSDPNFVRFGLSGIGSGSSLVSINQGDYQLEIRTSRTLLDRGDNLTNQANPVRLPAAYYGPNDRLTQGVSLQVNHAGSQINDGDFFTLSNGVNTVTFEFNNMTGGVFDEPTDGSRIRVDFNTSFTPAQIGGAIIAAINQAGVQSLLGIQASTAGGQNFNPADTIIALHGSIAADSFGGLDFDPVNPINKHLSPIIYGTDAVPGEDGGDSNRFVDQGQVIVQSTSIFGSSLFGIRTTATADANGLALPGPVKNLPVNNLTRQIPGVVLTNNLLVGNQAGGIQIVGGGQGVTTSAPFARVVNNTIFGGEMRIGVGIAISEGAAPTLLNNVISNSRNAVTLNNTNASEIVVLASLLQDNVVNLPAALVDPFVAIVTTSGVPVTANQRQQFRDITFGASNSPYDVNFYPAALVDSLLIDSSFASLEERGALDTVKTSVGILPSPIIAPEFDLVGRPRLDDSLVNPNIGGQGSSIFQDRGAIDSSDTRGPIARLLLPLDNDNDSLDNERLLTTVFRGDDLNVTTDISTPSDSILNFFAIQLIEPTGIGPDSRTVTSDQVIVTENGRPLTAGAEYTFGYSLSSRQIRLTPTAGLWKPDAVYEITLLNEDHLLIQTDDPQNPADSGTGFDIFDGDQLVVTGDRQVTLEFDAGYVLQLGQPLVLEVLEGVNASGIRFGDTVIVEYDLDNDRLTNNSRFVTLEFVAVGDTVSNATFVPVFVSSGASADEVSDAILTALTGLAPGGGGASIKQFLAINPFRIAAGVQFNAFAGQTIALNVSNNALRQIGNTFSVADGEVFTYTAGGGREGLTKRFEIDVLNDLGSAATTVAESFFFDDDVTLSVASATGFAVGNFIRSSNEIMLITAITGNNLTVQRGVLGTAIETALSGDEIVRLAVQATTSLAATVAVAATQITVRDAAALSLNLADGAPDYVRVGNELVRVTGLSGNVLTVVRGQLGTVASGQAINTVVSSIAASQSTTINETRLDSLGVLQPSTLLQNDLILTVNVSPSFDVRAGDLLQIGAEIARVISIVDNGLTLDLTIDRGEFATPISEVAAATTIYVVESNTIFVPVFASDVLDDRTATTGTIRHGVASRIANSVRTAGNVALNTDLRLTHARGIENGRVYLGGSVGDVVDLRGSFDNGLGALVVSTPGVTGGLTLEVNPTQTAATLDTLQFTITNQSVTPAVVNTFEFSIDANVPAGVRIVRIAAGATTAEIADRLANAILNAGLGINATVDPAAPTFVKLNETFDIAVDPLVSGLRVSGISGGAVAVSVIPSASFTADAVGNSILHAITSNPTLGLSGFTIGDGRIYLKSTSGALAADNIDVQGAGGFTVTQNIIRGIADLAANGLTPNRRVSQTKFTILLGEHELDYGDADSLRFPGQAPQTVKALLPDGSQDDAARHVILDGLAFANDAKLGVVVDGEANGVPGPTATADDAGLVAILSANLSIGDLQATVPSGAVFAPFLNGLARVGRELVKINAINGNTLDLSRGQNGTPVLDHVAGDIIEVLDDEDGLRLDPVRAVLNVSYNTQTPALLDVVSTAFGALDAWIDWNRDGNFDDPFELLTSGAPLVPGTNAISIVTPSISDIGFNVTGAGFGNNAILRLRISRNGGLLADQIAVGGEIEDHRVTIVSGAEPTIANATNATNRTFRWTEDVNGNGIFTSATGTSFNASNPNYGIVLPGAVDADGQVITVLEIIDPVTGRQSRVQGGSGSIVGLRDSLGRNAGDLAVMANGNFTFTTKLNYNTHDLPGVDRVLGNADDLDPQLVFFYRVIDSSGVPSSEVGTISIVIDPVNDLPTIDVIANVSINEDAAQQTIGLTGITTGGGEQQPLRVTAVSNNTVLINTVAIDYDGISTTANLRFTPLANIYGRATITVTVEDGGIDGNLATTTDNATVTRQFVVVVNPINDQPLAFARAFGFTESSDPVAGPAFTFTRNQLINGSGTETPAAPGNFPSTLGVPYNESEQSLRVVRFTTAAGSVDAVDLAPSGTGTLTLASDQGGTYAFDFVNGAFTEGRFTPSIDYNRRTPFQPTELFQYVIEDDGATTDPQPPGGQTFLPPLRSVAVTATITITEANDAPIFTLPNTISLTENDGSTVVFTDLITGIAPSELTALDELERQGVVVSVAVVNVPAGLMVQNPTLVVTGGVAAWPGTATLTVYPAADAFGFAVYAITLTDTNDGVARSTTKTLTIGVAPINDQPVTYNRALSVVEAVEVDGQAAVLSFTKQQLITGTPPELAAVAGLFPPTLAAPYNETEQALRVVAFNVPGATPVDAAINEAGLTGGTGTVSRTTANGSVLTFTFIAGEFDRGTYTPPVDYNQRTPFVANEQFSYIVSDDGRTTVPGSRFVTGGATDVTIAIGQERSAPAIVTLTTIAANDPPVFTVALNSTLQPAFDILERDDSLGTVIPAAVINIAPAPASARDELTRQTVSFTIVSTTTSVPGLLAGLTTISPTGTLTVLPAVDAVGQAVIVFDAIDAEAGTTGFVSRSTRGTLTINVRPVNDAPRLSPVAGTSLVTNPDEAWSVDAATGTITYTLKEDNTGAGGVTSPYVLNALQTAAIANRIGLLDPYSVGPANEADATLGGSQILRLTSVPINTVLNGSLTATDTDGDGFVDRIEYIPPVDYNSAQGPVDSFEYTFEDNAPDPLGETWQLTPAPGGLVTNRLSRTGRVEFVLNPVNDQPSFVIPSQTQSVLEDAGAVIVPGFVTDISQSPISAGDELAGQTLAFTLTPRTPENGLFVVSPTIGPDGNLTFTSAPDAVGSIQYEVILTDLVGGLPGPNDNARGDINSFGPVTITINVRPVNDQPRINPAVVGTNQVTSFDEAWSVATSGVITYTLPEDNLSPTATATPFVIETRRSVSTADRIGLLDPFVAGPANESDGTLGGSQILRVLNVPATTNLGGTLTAIRDANNHVTQVLYTPPVNYNSLQGANDFFNYVIEDDAPAGGETFNLGTGALVENRLTRLGRVEFVLNPVNDAPQFTIAVGSHSVLEDAGAISVPSFVTGILAGPTSASDETPQTRSFSVTAVTAENGLFAVSPAISSTGILTFTPAADAVGTIEYLVSLTDGGDPTGSGRGDINSTGPLTITINVRPVNDAPQLSASIVNTSLTTSLHEAWSVNSSGAITYTLAEDNTQSIGVDPPYVIDVRRSASAADRIGLLDVFTVGPVNEANSTLGGSQSLRVTAIPATTLLGGTLTVVARDANDNPTRIQYVPPANYNSAQGINDSFTYTIEDDAADSTGDLGETFDIAAGALVANRLTRTGTVQFILNPLNDPPRFSGAASVTVAEDSTSGAVVGQSSVANFVSSIATGPTGADDELAQTVSFTVAPVVGNAPGLFSTPPSVSPTGTLSFTTAPNANGVAFFTITADDGGGNVSPRESRFSAPVTFSITITSDNDAPTFTASGDVIVDEDSGPYNVTAPFATNISPGAPNEVTDGQTVSFTLTISPQDQALFAVLPMINAAGFLTFTPAADAVGTAIISITAADNLGALSVPALLSISILEVNDPPLALDFTVAANEDNLFVITAAEFALVAIDPDLVTDPNEVLVITDLQATSAFGATISIAANGDLLYEPRNSAMLQALRPGETRTDTVTYRLTDASGTVSDPATITINVSGRNDAPTAVDDTAVLLSGVSTILRPLDNDFDVDGDPNPALLIITQAPTNGSLSSQPDGTLIYTPQAGFSGIDTIRYTVADDRGQQSEQATIRLDIAPAPSSGNIVTGAFMGAPIDVDAIAGFNAPPGTLDLASIQISTPPTNGTATVLPDGTIRYVATGGFVGADSYAFTIRDVMGRISSPVVVTVNTVGSRLQNPQLFADVDANGRVALRDALLIVNHIARFARQGGGISVPVNDTDVGPNFVDVDGNLRATTSDALRVVNFIARQNRLRIANPEGERSLAAPEIATTSIDVMADIVFEPVATNMVKTINPAAIVAELQSPSDEMLELLAWDSDEKKKSQESERLNAIDEALSLLD